MLNWLRRQQASAKTASVDAAGAHVRSANSSLERKVTQTGGQRVLREAWRRSRPGLLVVFILTAFIALLKLTLPLYIFQLLDRVIASRSLDTVYLLTGIAVFGLTAGSIAELTRRWMLAHWSNWIEHNLGKDLFLSSVAHDRSRGPGRTLDDLNECSQFVAGSGATAWLDAMWAPAFVFIVYLIHPTLGYIVIGSIVLILVLGVAHEVITRPMRAAARRAKQRGDRWIATAEQNQETIAGLNVLDELADRWHRNLTRRGRENRNSRMTGSAISEAMRYIENGQRVACYGVGVWLAIGDSLTVGGIIAAAVLGRLGTAGIRRAMVGWRQLAVVLRAYQRIKRRLQDARPEQHAIRDPNAAQTLHIDQVTHTYSEWSRPVFRKVDLTVEPGQIMCILGPSGSGKSTLARLIAGTAEPVMGSVRLAGLDIARFTRFERQSLLGYLQQDTKLLSGTIAENITSMRRADEEAIVEAAKLAGIHNVILQLPDGYETEIKDQSNFLAGGEIRRLGIARAVFGRPHLIVLDEPEANLDEELVASLTRVLAICKSWGSIVVVTSQQERFAALADKIVILGKSAKPRIYGSYAEYSRQAPDDGPGDDVSMKEVSP
ncbi:MAG: type I secretion system permease/ATPase [Hyphomicrobiaceae bacterium]